MWNFPSCPCRSLQKESRKIRLWWRCIAQGQQGTQSNASLPCSQHSQHHFVHSIRVWIPGKVFSKEPHTDKDPLPFIDIKQGNSQKEHTTHQQKIYPSFLWPFLSIPPSLLCLLLFFSSFLPFFSSIIHQFIQQIFIMYLEKEMATHSSILAWSISWTEEPGGLQPMRSQESGTT